MKESELNKARASGARWVMHVADLKVGDDFYDFFWTIEEKRELEEEYRWNKNFEILEIKVVN